MKYSSLHYCVQMIIIAFVDFAYNVWGNVFIVTLVDIIIDFHGNHFYHNLNFLQCHLNRGIHPLCYPYPKTVQDWADDMEKRFLYAVEWGKRKGFVQKGSTIISLSGWRPGPAHTNTIRIFTIEWVITDSPFLLNS